MSLHGEDRLRDRMNQLETDLEAKHDKWTEVHEKIRQTLSNVADARDARIIELEKLAKDLMHASDDHLGQASARMLLGVDEVRRAQALFNAFETVDRWMTEGIPEDLMVPFEIKDTPDAP